MRFSVSHRCPGFGDAVEVGPVDQQQRCNLLGSTL